MDEFYCVFTAEVSSLYSRSFSVRNAYYETMWSGGYFVVDGHLPPPGHTPPDICLLGQLPPSTKPPQDIRPPRTNAH